MLTAIIALLSALVGALLARRKAASVARPPDLSDTIQQAKKDILHAPTTDGIVRLRDILSRKTGSGKDPPAS